MMRMSQGVMTIETIRMAWSAAGKDDGDYDHKYDLERTLLSRHICQQQGYAHGNDIGRMTWPQVLSGLLDQFPCNVLCSEHGRPSFEMAQTGVPTLTPDVIRALARQTVDVCNGCNTPQIGASPGSSLPSPPPLIPCRSLTASEPAVARSICTPPTTRRKASSDGSDSQIQLDSPSRSLTPGRARRRARAKPGPGFQRAKSAKQLANSYGGAKAANRKVLARAVSIDEPRLEPRRRVDPAIFDRLHKQAEHRQTELLKKQQMAIREQLETLRPPKLDERSLRIANKTCTQPLLERLQYFHDVRKQSRERAAEEKYKRESEQLTHKPEISARAAGLGRCTEDLHRWDEKRRQQIEERQTQRLEQMQQECTFHPQLRASSERFERRDADSQPRERLFLDASRRHASRGLALSTRAVGEPAGVSFQPHVSAMLWDSASARPPSIMTGNSASAATLGSVVSGAAKSGLPISFEDFMHARSTTPTKRLRQATLAGPMSSGAAGRPLVSDWHLGLPEAVPFECFRAQAESEDELLLAEVPRAVPHASLPPQHRLLSPQSAAASRSAQSAIFSTALRAPIQPTATRPAGTTPAVSLRPTSARPRASRRETPTISARSMSTSARRPTSAVALDDHSSARKPPAAHKPAGPHGTNFIRYNPEFEDVFMMTGLC